MNFLPVEVIVKTVGGPPPGDIAAAVDPTSLDRAILLSPVRPTTNAGFWASVNA
jgi:hypothetical protein